MLGRFAEQGEYRAVLSPVKVYSAVVAFALLIASFAVTYLPGFDAATWRLTGDVMALAVIMLLGTPIILEAILGLAHGRANVDELVALALIACVVAGEYLSGASVAFLMIAGSLFEERAAAKARRAIEELIGLSPSRAIVVRDGQEIEVDPSEVEIGETVIVRPGDQVPVDGSILRGASTLDQSKITGESVPAERARGDEVYAGTVNLTAALHVRTTRVAGDTTLGKIISIVERVEGEKVPVMRVVDRFAAYYTPAILVVAAAAYGITLISTGHTEAFRRLITVLIVGCPCPIILAGPTAIIAGMARAARLGILIKSGSVIERAAQIDTVVFDKTGTLTTGRHRVVQVLTSNGIRADELIRLAASAERHSSHPFARALAAEAESRGLSLSAAESHENIVANGIRACVEGQSVAVGKVAFIARETESRCDCAWAGDSLARGGYSTLAVSVDRRPAGVILMADTIRERSAEIPGELRAIGLRQLIMLTGDGPAAAERVAKAVGVDETAAGLLPEDKADWIDRLRKSGARVAFVGDGVNDAPALAVADVGVAMGSAGADVAIEAAEVALLGDDLSKLPQFFRLSRAVRQTIHLNLIFAASLGAVALMLAATGVLSPVMGAILHNLGSAFVVANSTRLATTLRLDSPTPRAVRPAPLVDALACAD